MIKKLKQEERARIKEKNKQLKEEEKQKTRISFNYMLVWNFKLSLLGNPERFRGLGRQRVFI